ncbi:MAG TPA: RDD family protein [Vineibacter sp.]|nr:RDD family protein [Vineibacter sp.]
MSNQGQQPPSWQQRPGQPAAPNYPAAPPHPGYGQPQPGYGQPQPGYGQQPGYPQPPAHPGYTPPPGYAAPPGYAPPGYPPQGYAPASGGVVFAGFWIRVGAYIIDGFILGIPVMIVMGIVFATMMPGLMSGGEPSPDAIGGAVGAFVIVYLLIFVAAWLYEAMLTASPAGGTLGKRVVGVRVVRGSDGTQLTFGRATGRFFAKLFITGIIPFGIGYMMAGFTERKRALHDMIADTVVIKK